MNKSLLHKRVMHRASCMVILVLGSQSAAQTAHAQAAIAGNREPIDVAGTRPQPEYDPTGTMLGGLGIFPSLEIKTEYESNVFFRPSDIVGDGSLSIDPTLTMRQISSDYPLTLTANGQIKRYFSLTRQDIVNGFFNGAKTFALTSDDLINIAGSWSDSAVSRGTFENELQVGDPLRARNWTSTIRYQHIGGEVEATLTGNFGGQNYSSVHLDNGQYLDQSYRDVQIAGATLNLAHELHNGLAVTATVTFNDLSFKDPSALTNRSATSLSGLLGFNYELSGLLFVQAGLGAVSYNFKNPAYSDFHGLALQLSAHWYPTELLTFKLDTAQTTSTSAYSGISGVSVTSVRSVAIYEIKRNLNFEVHIGYQYQDYFSLKETAGALDLSTSLIFKINRHLNLRGSLSYQSQSQAPLAFTPRYKSVIGALSLTTAL